MEFLSRRPAQVNPACNVAGKRDGCGGGGHFYQLPIARKAPGTGMSVDPGLTPVNAWTHIAIVADGIRGWVAFVNGKPAKQVSETNWKIQNSAPFTIGGAKECRPFNGRIASVSLYNHALSDREVMAAYQNGLRHLHHPNRNLRTIMVGERLLYRFVGWPIKTR